MQIAKKPPNEAGRLAFLHSLEILDTPPEDRFDSVTRLACATLGANYAAVSLIDSDRQWFKSQCGLDVDSTSRDVSFCGHTILEDETLIVEDALDDLRFHDNPLVTGGPNLRAYMGHPLTVSGVAVGTLCVLYTEPRTFEDREKELLRDLARLVEEMIIHSRFRESMGDGINAALQASDASLRKAIQISSEPTALIRMDTGVVTDLNQACADELGVEIEAARDQAFPGTLLVPVEVGAKLRVTLENGGKVKNVEVGVRVGANKLVQFLCSGEAVYFRGEQHLLLTGRNISHLKNRESLIRQAHRAVGGTTGQDYFDKCARTIARLLGVRYGFVLGTQPAGGDSPEILGFWKRETIATVDQSTFQDFPRSEMGSWDAPVHIPTGVRQQFPSSESLRALGIDSYYGYPIVDGEGAICGQLVVMDSEPFLDESGEAALLLGTLAARTAGELERQRMHLTLEEARDRAELASRAKGSFLSNMSHELRTPMNAILGFSQLMSLDEALPDAHKETLKIINQSGEHLLCLINDVLEMSKVEAGKIEIDTTPNDPAQLVETVEAMLSARARQKGLSLAVSICPDVPALVQLDEGKTRQILVNLAGNAIKFTDSGRVDLRLGVVADGSALRFEIEDTGRGIAQELQQKLFHPFEQIERLKGLEGTGLGLSISKAYAEAMGGSIGVESTLNAGSVFSLVLPLVTVEGKRASEDPGRPGRPAQRELDFTSGDARILIVDDLAPGRLLLRKLLEPLGVHIMEATNGKEAIEAEQNWCPHVVLMDLRMPVMEGDEASRIIRSRRGQNTPAIIAITASVFREDLVGGDNPFDDYIAKPFRIAELTEKLAPHLERLATA